MKLIKNNIELFIMYGCVAALCFFFACGDTIIVEPTPDPGPPPPPPIPECDQEVEPNDSFLDADYLGVFPINTPESVCGDMYIWPPHDADVFFLFLSAPELVEEIHVNIVVSTDMYTTPKVNLYQTIYDDNGNPTEEYELIGQYIQGPGLLVIQEAAIPHDPIHNNDLFIVLEAFGDPYHIAEYEMEYWSN